MKNKKIVMIFGILLILILLGGYFGIKYVKNKDSNQITEYTPEAEITEEQSRQTIVSLYFINAETGELYPEARLVDIKELMKDIYRNVK